MSGKIKSGVVELFKSWINSVEEATRKYWLRCLSAIQRINDSILPKKLLNNGGHGIRCRDRPSDMI